MWLSYYKTVEGPIMHYIQKFEKEIRFPSGFPSFPSLLPSNSDLFPSKFQK